MSQSRRLPADRVPGGGRIDRDRPLHFTFNAVRYEGYEGDTLASALLANDVRLVGRSFKFHRPRGIVSAGPEEPSAIVQVGRGPRVRPNQQATTLELFEDLEATSVNCWPGPGIDLLAVNNVLHRLLPAGFYYKTFMWPAWFWRVYEHLIRHAAGLGHAPRAGDPDTYDKMNVHCDVLVVGGGPAGLAAALAAGRAGARVIVSDQQAELGGALLGERTEIAGAPALDWVASAAAALATMADVRVLKRTTAFGYYDHNFLGLVERRWDHVAEPPEGARRQRLWRVRAGEVVLATGAIERPLVFADNDRPGIMLAGAVRTYLNRYGVAPGERVAVFTNDDDAYQTALDLKDSGVDVAAIVDVRSAPDGALPDAALEKGIEVVDGAAVTRVLGARRVNGIEVTMLESEGGGLAGEARAIPCDLLCVSGGWNPTVHLHGQSGARARFDEDRGIFVPGEPVQRERSAGTAAGAFGLGAALVAGAAAGTDAALAAGFRAKRAYKPPAVEDQEEAAPGGPWSVPARAGRGHRHFVDLANDVTEADIALAAREGYESVEHTKRYTTLGMGPDQGKTGNVLGMALLGRALGSASLGSVGTATFRPPFTPVTFGALAGRDVGAFADPVRRTPIHHWHERIGARWEDVGQWKRPWYYPEDGEDLPTAVDRECLAVRGALGIMDASTLGKIDIQGLDAVKLLNRVYTNAWDSLAVGRCRYGLMLGEDGMVMDDGVTARLGEHHYRMTTTSGNAARVLAALEEWVQTEWPELRVYMTSVTEQFATVTLAGPNARRLLAELTRDIDLAPAAFPFMSVREGTVAGIPARVFRVSYTGELSFEIGVPASVGLALWTAFVNAGETYGITPFGTEAMHVLRAEKGFIVVGQETDGTVTPLDLGMDWIVSKRKDFIGRRSLARPDTARPDRKQLVGLRPEDPEDVLPEGAQISAGSRAEPPVPMIGHVTSSYYSAVLGHSFALALVKAGRSRHGETVYLPLEDRTRRATVCDPVFFDPEGERLRG